MFLKRIFETNRNFQLFLDEVVMSLQNKEVINKFEDSNNKNSFSFSILLVLLQILTFDTV